MPFLRFATFAVLAAMLVAGPAAAADDDIYFTANLSPDNQSIPTYGPATGFALVWLERETLRLHWKVAYNDLTTPPTIAGLYGPENVGANAGQVVDLAPNGIKNPIEGSQVLSDGVFQYLITSRMYVNIHTKKYPDGELRGQLRRQITQELRDQGIIN